MISTALSELQTHLAAGSYTNTVSFVVNYLPTIRDHETDADFSCYIYATNMTCERQSRCDWGRRYNITLTLISWGEPSTVGTAAQRQVLTSEEVLSQLESFSGSTVLDVITMDDVFDPEQVDSRAVLVTNYNLELRQK